MFDELLDIEAERISSQVTFGMSQYNYKRLILSFPFVYVNAFQKAN